LYSLSLPGSISDKFSSESPSTFIPFAKIIDFIGSVKSESV
jgi:hypothetical protein